MKLMLYNTSGKNTVYKNIGYFDNSGSYRKNVKILGLGNSLYLKEINPDYEKIIKRIITKYDERVNVTYLKTEIFDALKYGETGTKNIFCGGEIINKFIDKNNLFKNFSFGKTKGMIDILKYQITNRIVNPGSILNSYLNKEKTEIDLNYSKNSFYRSLEVLLKNKNEIIKNMNEIRSNKTKKEEVFFDSTTIYFESFQREGLRIPGYSKDGKFKEDQIVMGMACDINGIPIFYKVFPGNTADVKTLIPFFNEFKLLFPDKKIIVVADRGMSSAENIKFLEKNQIDFLISYRAKVASKKYKEYLLNETDYVILNDDYKYKERQMLIQHNKDDSKLYERKQVISISKLRAKVDAYNRNIEIKNFKKHQNADGYVNEKAMIGSKKAKYFKQINKSKYVLDVEKIKYDKQFDGIYVYETSLINIHPNEIISMYSEQWRIEENFRTLKNNFAIRPMYVYTDEHIEGHILLCFVTLFVFKMIKKLVNDFYKKWGVIDKLTDTILINLIKNLNKTALIDNYSQTTLNVWKNIDTDSTISWKFFNEFLNYIINS